MIKITEINDEKVILINSDNITDDMDFAEKNDIKNIIISQYENIYFK